VYKILINIITKNKDKWIFYQEDGADYVASSLDDIKDKALELLDEYGEDNVKIVDQRSGDDSKKDIPTYLFGNGTGGTSDYNELENKPKINGVELINNKSLKDLGIIIPLNEDFTLEGLGEKSYNSLDDKPKIPKKVSELENDSKYETEESTDTKIAGAKSYADEAVAHLVGSAPETLDTLEEVAKAIQDNETVVDALNAAIGSKADKTELGTKQDKLTAGDGIDIKDNIISVQDQLPYVIFDTKLSMYNIGLPLTRKEGESFDVIQNFLNKKYDNFYIIIRYNNYSTLYAGDIAAYRGHYNDHPDLYSVGKHSERFFSAATLADNGKIRGGSDLSFVTEPVLLRITLDYTVGEDGTVTLEQVALGTVSSDAYLPKNNTSAFTPTKDYHPATKKYVDDALANIDVSFDDVYVVTCGHRFDGGYFNITDDGSITEMMNKYWPKYLANRNQGGLVIWKDYTAYTNGTTLIGYMRGTEIYIQWPWTSQNNGLASNPYGSVGVVTITGSWDSSTETYTLTKAIWKRTNYVPTQDYNPANKKYVDDTISAKGGDKLHDYNIYTITLDDYNLKGTFPTITDTTTLAKFDEILTDIYKKRITANVTHDNAFLIVYSQSDTFIFRISTIGSSYCNLYGTYIEQPIDYNGYTRSYQFNITGTLDATAQTFKTTKVKFDRNSVRLLLTNNTLSYTPTSDYNPATKKYVDDQVGNINTVLATLTTVSEVTK
jgi:hypothetical protein